MGLELYHNPNDYLSNMVVAILKKLDIEFSITEVAKGEESKLPEEITKYTPDAKLPAIMDGDFGVCGDRTIIRYLIQERNIKTTFFPLEDLQTRSKINSFLDHEQMGFRLAYKSLLEEYEKDPKQFSKDGFQSEEVSVCTSSHNILAREIVHQSLCYF